MGRAPPSSDARPLKALVGAAAQPPLYFQFRIGMGTQMTQLQNQQTATPETADLNDAELLGFEHIETVPGSSTSTEDAVALALNKRGEGPAISDRPLKTHVQRAGGTAEGLNLYSFRYIGEDHGFRGVMAQELLADERNR